MLILNLQKELVGSILDIGGGGEAIIGRLYGNCVTAIDNNQYELDEAPNVCEKILMDATNLRYQDASFDNVTFFFSLMFMQEEEQKKAIAEAARVLKKEGQIHIWDCDILSAYPDPFSVDIEINLPNKRTIKTTYGIGKLGMQNKDSIQKMCTDAGLSLSFQYYEGYFYLKLEKHSS